jgi:hypothetical protein
MGQSGFAGGGMFQKALMSGSQAINQAQQQGFGDARFSRQSGIQDMQGSYYDKAMQTALRLFEGGATVSKKTPVTPPPTTNGLTEVMKNTWEEKDFLYRINSAKTEKDRQDWENIYNEWVEWSRSRKKTSTPSGYTVGKHPATGEDVQTMQDPDTGIWWWYDAAAGEWYEYEE